MPSFCHEQPLPCKVKAKAVDRNTGFFNLRGESSVLFGSSQSCVTPSDLDQMMVLLLECFVFICVFFCVHAVFVAVLVFILLFLFFSFSGRE